MPHSFPTRRSSEFFSMVRARLTGWYGYHRIKRAERNMERGEMTKQSMLSVVGGPAETLTGAGARLRLLLAAKLVMTTGELPVTLRELSSTNAVVTGDGLPSVGTDALLKIGRASCRERVCQYV